MLKYYKDPDLKIQVETLDLGKLKAGHKKQFTYYVYNDNMNEIEEIKFSTEVKDIEILQAPEELKEKSKDKIVIEWSPSISIKQGLKAKLNADYYEVVEGQ